jgi:hypothetical protein
MEAEIKKEKLIAIIKALNTGRSHTLVTPSGVSFLA